MIYLNYWSGNAVPLSRSHGGLIASGAVSPLLLEGSHALRHSWGQGELLAQLDVRSALGCNLTENQGVRNKS